MKNKEKSDFDFFRFYAPDNYDEYQKSEIRVKFRKIFSKIAEHVKNGTYKIPETL